MARLSILAVSLILVAAGGAYAAPPPSTDSRGAAVADNQATPGTNVAESIYFERKPTQVTEQRAPKRRVWISMGFGF